VAVRLEGVKKPKRKVLLVLGEFVSLGRMERLINIANMAVGCSPRHWSLPVVKQRRRLTPITGPVKP
jgi:hypothetical protein